MIKNLTLIFKYLNYFRGSEIYENFKEKLLKMRNFKNAAWNDAKWWIEGFMDGENHVNLFVQNFL